MNVKKIGILLVVIATALTVGVASAQDGNGNGNGGGNGRGGFRSPDRPGRLGLLGDPPGIGLRLNLAEIVADHLGIELRELLIELQDQTLAEVIEAYGGDVDQITADLITQVTERVNAAVADGTITQERADALLANLEEAVQDALSGDGARFGLGARLRGQLGQDRPRAGQFFGRLDARHPLMNGVMDATGLNGRELMQALSDGSTLAELISANGGDPSAVVADALAQATERVNLAVENGNLTQDQATEIIEGLQAFYEAALTATNPMQADLTGAV